MTTITLAEVIHILEVVKGVAYPYPRKGQISINGGKGRPATTEAIKYAQAFYRAKQ